jgi:hypothetical protein
MEKIYSSQKKRIKETALRIRDEGDSFSGIRIKQTASKIMVMEISIYIHCKIKCGGLSRCRAGHQKTIP